MAVACLINVAYVRDDKKKLKFLWRIKQVIVFKMCQKCTDETKDVSGRVGIFLEVTVLCQIPR